MVDNRLHHSSVKLNLELDKNLPNVLGEESSMEQVFINILLNAIDALLTMPDEYKKEISIGTKYNSAEDKIVVLIGNNGPEIPKMIINKVFEPFFTTKGPGYGTGLGLSISYGILQSHGGNISVENTGNGPCFTIKLPVENTQSFDK
jgi:two-component system NtrC family sensor kinase